MTISMLLLLSGCTFLGETQTRYWGGFSTQYDAEGTQVGNAAEILVRQDIRARDHEIIEESWRFGDDGVETDYWLIQVQGTAIDSRFDDPGGNVVILGEFTRGQAYEWTEWNYIWTWVDGERAGDWIRIDGEITDRDLHMDKAWRDGQDALDYTRTEDLTIKSAEEFDQLLAAYGS